MQLGRIEGDFADRLSLDSSELLDTGWQQYLHRPPWATLVRLEMDKRAARSGYYELPFVSRQGHRLYVAVRTLVLHTGDCTAIAGTVTLLNWESPRRILDLGA
jgi:hypothetical protein